MFVFDVDFGFFVLLVFVIFNLLKAKNCLCHIPVPVHAHKQKECTSMYGIDYSSHQGVKDHVMKGMLHMISLL